MERIKSILKIYIFQNIYSKNGGSMVRKIRVILNIKDLKLKSKIKNQKIWNWQILWHFWKFQFGKLFSKIRFLILILILILIFEIPNHKSSFKKIQKCKKIEILLDWNSKPQKFFQKNPEVEENEKTALGYCQHWIFGQKFDF